jgi:hypothetical protein
MHGCVGPLQGEFAAGWFTDHLIVAEGLVNSLAEKFNSPLQVISAPVVAATQAASCVKLHCYASCHLSACS